MNSFEQKLITKENPFLHFEELIIPIQELLKNMRDSINKGEYGTIIGEDASARIPTLILNNVINDIYKENKFEPIQLMFIAGSSSGLLDAFGKTSEKQKKIEEYLLKYLKNKNKKVLISTEYIYHGDGLKPLVNALRENNISYDISTVSILGDNNTSPYEINHSTLDNLNKKIGNIYFGKVINFDTKEIPGKIYHKRFNGVKKHPLDILAKSIKKSNIFNDEKIEETNIEIQEEVNQAREEVKKLSDQLTTWYKNNL